MSARTVIAALIALTGTLQAAPATTSPPTAPGDVDWPVYGASASEDRYSDLKQITPANVARLKLAWRFDMPEPGDSETSPIITGGTLFAYTPDLKVIALGVAK